MDSKRSLGFMPIAGFTVIVGSSLGLAVGMWADMGQGVRYSVLLNSGLALLVGIALLLPWVFSKVVWRAASPKAEWQTIRSKGFARFYLSRIAFPIFYAALMLLTPAWSKSQSTRERPSHLWIFLLLFTTWSAISPWFEWRNNEKKYSN